MEVREKLYIDGRWVPSAGTGMIDVICGSTEEVRARIPEGNAADVDAAVRSARAAVDGWAATPGAARPGFLRKTRGGVREGFVGLRECGGWGGGEGGSDVWRCGLGGVGVGIGISLTLNFFFFFSDRIRISES